MDRELIIRLAQECQLIGFRPHLDGIYQEVLEHFAALVAAAEREECAKVCDLVAREINDTNGTATYIATAIRSKA